MGKRTPGLNVDFQFIAKYPSAILIAGGLLMILLDKTGWAIFLIGVGVLVHVLWIDRRYR